MGISGTQQALMYALGGIMRGGASRGGYVSGHAFIAIGGVQRRGDILMDSLTITDELDETANKCSFRIIGGSTLPGTPVRITLGSINNGAPLFAGYVNDIAFSYWQRTDRTANYYCDVNCLDYTWQLGFAKVTAQYRNQSATAIAKDLVASYAAINGFTANAVQADLPALAEITYTNEDLTDAMTRLARRIGAYWYVDYSRDVHLFFDEPDIPPPVELTPTHPSLAHVVKSADRSQTLTRTYVEGRGSTLLGPVAAGDTLIPLEAVDMFAPAPDVFLKASFQGSDGGAQHLNFTEVVTGGAGSLVGPGIAPTGALTVALKSGTGIEAGAHAYAFTWVTAAGETKPSPLASVTHGGPVVAPTVAPSARNDPNPSSAVDELTAGAWKPGDTVQWAYSWAVEDSFVNSTPISPSLSLVATTSVGWFHEPGHSARAMLVKIPSSPDPRVKWVYIWHRVNAGGWRVWNYGEPVGIGHPNYPNLPPPFEATFELPATYSDGATPPASGTSYQQTTITGIAVGPTAVTARKLYRTVAAGAQLKLLQTLANNTATTATDAAADATLGANAPTGDTSAIPQPAGQVAAGDPTIIVTSTGPFRAAGGWAVIGNGEQVVRYTGISGNTLTGIPATGLGSIGAAIAYNSTMTAAPMLAGIPATGPRAITRALTAGDEIYLVVQADDAARQSQLAAAMGGNGIREEWDQDRRLSIPEARARASALLRLRELDRHSLSYTCRDLRTASGRLVLCNLPTMTSGYFKIQRVTWANFRPYPTQYPTATVEASSSRFSFEDLLRSARTKE